MGVYMAFSLFLKTIEMALAAVLLFLVPMENSFCRMESEVGPTVCYGAWTTTTSLNIVMVLSLFEVLPRWHIDVEVMFIIILLILNVSAATCLTVLSCPGVIWVVLMAIAFVIAAFIALELLILCFLGENYFTDKTPKILQPVCPEGGDDGGKKGKKK
ncbi:unnamed protein product [Cyprideis torosa]|uniref:Uncharacterized protein n=1 Tax=Cyprideis torosa TaxID=163714 RepID=A0A7R8WBQ9_9CRUS|nr:unnamed protein product [Cyprideis torosa]CAG0886723.1 unnamed protein product [Cyprideis torosa]